jgi:hypothetical protein
MMKEMMSPTFCQKRKEGPRVKILVRKEVVKM